MHSVVRLSMDLSYLSDAGCTWVRLKIVLLLVFLVPLFGVIMYLVLRSTTYVHIQGIVKSTNGNVANVNYTYNNEYYSTAINTYTHTVPEGSKMALYIDPENPKVVQTEPKLTTETKIIIIIVLTVIISTLLCTLIVFMYFENICKYVGGADLASYTIKRTVDAFRHN